MIPGKAEIKNDDGAWMLRDAIILNMTKEYRVAYRRVIEYEDSGKSKKTDAYKMLVNDLLVAERLFHTNWFEILTDIDGGYITKGLRKEVERKYAEEKKEMDQKSKGETA